MQCMNEVTILGRLGAAVRKFTTPNGSPYVTFSIGTNEKVRNATEEKEIRTWHACEAWGNLATIIERLNINVGQEVLVKGKLRNSNFTDKKGTEHQKTTIVALDVKIFPLVQKTASQQNLI